MIITSKDNENIKSIKKLKDKKYRDETNKYIIEGIKLITEAINEKIEIDTIVICEDCLKDNSIDKKLLYEIAKYNCLYVNKTIFNWVTDVKNPQGVLAVVKKSNQNDKINFNEDLIVILDNIQDPGNLGTILRTIDSVRINTNNKIKRKWRCI